MRVEGIERRSTQKYSPAYYIRSTIVSVAATTNSNNHSAAHSISHDSFRPPIEPQLIKTWNEQPPQATAANTVDTFVESLRKKHQPSRSRQCH